MKIYLSDDKISCITDLNSLTKAVSKANRSVELLTIAVSALAVCVITHNHNARYNSECTHNRLNDINNKIRKLFDKEHEDDEK